MRRYPSGVVIPAPLSWHAVTMRNWDMRIERLSRVRSTVNGRTTPSWARKWRIWACAGDLSAMVKKFTRTQRIWSGTARPV